MFDRKKPLEEKIGTAIEAEFEGLVAELERDLADYRRRSRLKEKARITLEEAEAEARRVHLERVALKKRFWEAYYGNDEATLKKIEPEHRSLTRATEGGEVLEEGARELRKGRLRRGCGGGRVEEEGVRGGGEGRPPDQRARAGRRGATRREVA